jgi:DNA-binding FrmR family transcriptional regulator
MEVNMKDVNMRLCGDDHDHKRLIDRLSRIEGQVRGIRKMVEADRPCMDVLKQIAAVSGAVRGLGLVVLEDHMKGCVTDALRGASGDEDLIEQVMTIFRKFAK